MESPRKQSPLTSVLETGLNSPGASKENDDPGRLPPLSGKKRFSPGFSPLGKRHRQLRDKRGDDDLLIKIPQCDSPNRKTAQRSLNFGSLTKPASGQGDGVKEQEQTLAAAAPGKQPVEVFVKDAKDTTVTKITNRGSKGTCQADFSDLPEDGAEVSHLITGSSDDKPSTPVSLPSGRVVLAELEGVLLKSLVSKLPTEENPASPPASPPPRSKSGPRGLPWCYDPPASPLPV